MILAVASYILVWREETKTAAPVATTTMRMMSHARRTSTWV